MRRAGKSPNLKPIVFAALFASLTGCDFSDSVSSDTSPTPNTDPVSADVIAPETGAQNPQSGVSASAPPNPAFTEENETQSLGAATNAADSNQRFGDRFWAELAQDYPPFTPEPDTGFANGNDQPELVGQWEPLVDWPLIATGAANLPDGRILGWSSSSALSFGGGANTQATIYDPESNDFIDVPHDSHNMFCSGVSMLADGRVFAVGGGSRVTSSSTFSNQIWTRQQEMWSPRWYTTATTLPSGQVLSSLGTNNTGMSELWTESEGWSLMPNVDFSSILNDTTTNAGPANWYPLINVAPDGRIFHPGPTSEMISVSLDILDSVVNHGLREQDHPHRLYGATVMYDVGKMLMAGGGTPAIDSAITIDINAATPVVQETNPPQYNRSFQNVVALPDGRVLMIGGNQNGQQFSDETTVLVPELWDPATEIWTPLAPHERPRNYHSTALLMQDARVIAMGGGLCGGCATNHPNSEIFSPPYLFDSNGDPASRPTLSSASTSASAGDIVSFAGSNGIAQINMVRLAALTHHHTTDQRFIPLAFQADGAGNYDVELPGNPNVLIPGYYWVFAIDQNGVPSVGYTLHVAVTAEAFTPPSTRDPNTLSFTYEYFEGDWSQLPDFDTLPVVQTGPASDISIAPRQATTHYGLRFSAPLLINKSGNYEFFLTSDDGSRLIVDDSEIISNDGVHGTVEKTGTIFLSEGIHELSVEYFQRAGLDWLSLDVAGPELPRVSARSLLAPAYLQQLSNAHPVNYSYYEGEWSQLPDFAALTPIATGTQASVSLENRQRDDHFGMRFSSLVKLQDGGQYTFYLGSDDGSTLKINGNVVIFNDGLHGYREINATINLPAGYHSIEVDYFERGGSASIVLDVAGPSIARQPVTSLLTAYPSNEEGSNGFLFNGGFDDGLLGWSVCSSGALTSADNISDGSLLLSDDACVYQNIAVTTGDELTLSCQAQTDGDGYTSLRLAVSDENFSTLDSNEIEIVDTNGNTYSTSLTAPNSTSNAVVVLYSEGMAEFDSCVLSINGATHPTTTSTNPQTQLASTLPDSAGPSLLLNGGFESQLQDWESCNILNTASITSASVSGDAALQLDAPTCLYQLVPLPTAGTAYASCSASNDALKYTSLSLSFSDATFDALGSTSRQISSPGYAPATVSAVIPDTASYAAITLYSEGESRMDDCVLVIDP